ncbi:hypothetical protein PSPO01_01632 [Paraphaeosphaeria sporulosa]
MSQQSNTKDIWLRLTSSKSGMPDQERRQALQTGRDSVAAGNPFAGEPRTSDALQTSSQPLRKARGASHPPQAKPEAPTKRPTPSHASTPPDSLQPGKMCCVPSIESHASSKRSEDSEKPQHEHGSTPTEDEDDNDGNDTCPLLYFYENLYKLRELDALPQNKSMDD